MPDNGSFDVKALWARRRGAFERFEQWEHAFALSRDRTPEQKLAAAAGLYDLLPARARQRPIVTSGVAELHRRLGVLRPTR